jgi:hypothetical protein
VSFVLVFVVLLVNINAIYFLGLRHAQCRGEGEDAGGREEVIGLCEKENANGKEEIRDTEEANGGGKKEN